MIRILTYGSSEYNKQVQLRFIILRKPLGLTFSSIDLQNEKNDLFISYCKGNKQIGGCVLTVLEENFVIKLRQMFVIDRFKRQGIGRKIVEYSENWARQHSYKKIILNARESAVNFYTKLGYKSLGSTFVEVSLPHYKMIKDLT